MPSACSRARPCWLSVEPVTSDSDSDRHSGRGQGRRVGCYSRRAQRNKWTHCCSEDLLRTWNQRPRPPLHSHHYLSEGEPRYERVHPGISKRIVRRQQRLLQLFNRDSARLDGTQIPNPHTTERGWNWKVFCHWGCWMVPVVLQRRHLYETAESDEWHKAFFVVTITQDCQCLCCRRQKGQLWPHIWSPKRFTLWTMSITPLVTSSCCVNYWVPNKPMLRTVYSFEFPFWPPIRESSNRSLEWPGFLSTHWCLCCATSLERVTWKPATERSPSWLTTIVLDRLSMTKWQRTWRTTAVGSGKCCWRLKQVNWSKRTEIKWNNDTKTKSGTPHL